MKYKILALCISACFVAGCSDDNDLPPKQSVSLQAFDGAVWGMDSKYTCEDGTSGTLNKTDYNGNTTLEVTFDVQVVTNPEKCQFTFLPTENAVDTSNGKDMSDVTYKIPTGLASASGAGITASPISTLIADTLGDTPYDESSAQEVLESLGLGDLTTVSGISVTEFLQDVEGSLAKIKESGESELFSLISATNVVLSDTLVANPDADPADLATAANNLTATVLVSYPEYPMNDAGEEIYVEVKEVSKELDTLTDPEYDPTDPSTDIVIPDPSPSTPPEEPDDPTEPPTGGTGGTGGTGDGGTGG